MKSVCRLIAILLLLFPFGAGADVKLWLWKPQNALLPFILPAENGDSAQMAARKYVRAIRQEPELRELLNPILDSFLDGRSFGLLDKKSEWGFIATNMPDDYIVSPKYKRIAGLKEVFAYKKIATYLYPVAGGIHISKNRRQQLYDDLAFYSTLVTLVGGDDFSPELYTNRRNNPHCRNCNLMRDQWDFELLKGLFQYIEFDPTYAPTILAICRSMQAVAAYFGHQLIPDIPARQILDGVEHKHSLHEIQLLETKWNHLRKAFGGLEKVMVNSIHHQAAWARLNSLLQAGAVAPDGILEALEFELGLLVQFHPELMPQLYPVIYYIVDYARERRRARLDCEDLLSYRS